MTERENKEDEGVKQHNYPSIAPIAAPPTVESSGFLYTHNSIFGRPTVILLVIPNEEQAFYETVKTISEMITFFGINAIIQSFSNATGSFLVLYRSL